jgi:hypothetical protein
VHATGREPLNVSGVSGAMTMRTAFPSVRNSSASPLDDLIHQSYTSHQPVVNFAATRDQLDEE